MLQGLERPVVDVRLMMLVRIGRSYYSLIVGKLQVFPKLPHPLMHGQQWATASNALVSSLHQILPCRRAEDMTM